MAATGLRRRLERWMRPRHAEALPVRIDRQRIYVLPTPFGGFVIALLATMAAGALNYNNNPALLLCLLLGGATLASLLWTQLQLSGLEVRTVRGEPVPAGRPMLLHVHVDAAPGRERRGLRVDCEDAVAAPLSLDETGGEATLALPTQRRGWMAAPRLRISSTRPLGLARAWAWVRPDVPLLVHPTPEPHGPPLPLGAGEDAQARLHPAGDDLHHLRDWRQGDARRAIAWKSSARRDALVVREFERPQGTDVVLDWATLGGLAHEARIGRLARWVDAAERDGVRWLLRVPGHPPLGPDRGAHHRQACLRVLALMPDRP
ncbi:DUF58 domain-containing protein [Luteimonas sp. gir]|uniref:DUF58 domain-containing protein n=1 Tax=Luteimonas sp. gir TaxID=3127960 RepID=UPI003075E50D